MLSVVGLHAGYGGGTVLHDVSLHVPASTVSVVVGLNGAGKTTLLNSIAGLQTAARGEILIGDIDLAGKPAHRVARAGVGLVPQGRRVWGSLTVREQLQLPRSPRAGTVREPGPWTMERALTVFPQLSARLRTRGGHLSGGEQQMLAVARALLTQPRLLLLDEPTEGLAPALVDQLLTVIAGLPDDGITVLAAVPSASLAARIGADIHILAAGRITGRLTGAQARADPTLLATGLTTGAPRPAVPAATQPAGGPS